MGEEEFLSAMTMCRILPGANQVNMAVFVGTKMRGIPGAVAALLGLCLLPVVFILVLGWHCQLEESEGDFRRFASAIHQVACDL